ncbi:MAG: type II toxin-antitoxin system RelE/ParE family toxin [Ignavibacteriota bacterium]
MYEIKIYTKANGKSPFREWFNDLDRQTQIRVESRIDRLYLGNFGDSKAVGEGVQELRLHFGPGYRLYFSTIGKQIVLLLTGGDKSTQDQDIKNAKEYYEEYRKSKIGSK